MFRGSISRRNYKCYTSKINELRDKYSCNTENWDQPVICGTAHGMKEGICFEELEKKCIQLHDVGATFPKIEHLVGADYAKKLFSFLIGI